MYIKELAILLRRELFTNRSLAFGAIFLVLLITRVGNLAMDPDMEPVGDESSYLRGGSAFVELIKPGPPSDQALSQFYGHGWHPPVGKIVAGVPFRYGGMPAARGVQTVIAILMPLYLYLLVGRFMPRRYALLAFLAATGSPTLLGYTNLVWTENLYLLMTCWAMLRAIDAIDADRNRVRDAIRFGALAGLLLLLKPAFLPVLLAVSFWLILLGLRNVRFVLIAFLVAIPISATWDTVIKSQEGVWIHGSTATKVHLLAKYNDRNLDRWIKAWHWSHEEGREQGRHFTEVAGDAWKDDFLSRSFAQNLSIVGSDALDEMFLEVFFLERHVRRGYHWIAGYPDAATYFLVAEFVTRFLVVIFGFAGLLMGALPRKIRWLLLAVVAGNLAILFVGLPNPRHILQIYLPLLIGAIDLSRVLISRQRIIELLTAIAMVGAIGWTAFLVTTGGVWSARFGPALKNIGIADADSRDTVEMRVKRQCRGKPVELQFISRDGQPTVQINGKRSSAERTQRIGRGQMLEAIFVRPAGGPAPQLRFSADGESASRPLVLSQMGRDWVGFGECVEYRWAGNQ